MMEEKKIALIEGVRTGKKTAHESEKSYSKKTNTGLEYTITYKADSSTKVNDSKIAVQNNVTYVL